jgi:carbon storage regulator CsrA
MLVLSRCCDREIVINSNIRIRVGEIVGGRVRLLIDAPRECLVRREESPTPHIETAATH